MSMSSWCVVPLPPPFVAGFLPPAGRGAGGGRDETHQSDGTSREEGAAAGQLGSLGRTATTEIILAVEGQEEDWRL